MRVLQLLALALLQSLAAASSLRVCVVIEPGFDFLKDDSVEASAVTSDAQMDGFNADVRNLVLTLRLGWQYEIAVMPSWGEMNVRTRTGDCDIGWAPFYVVGDRDRCAPDANSCQPASSIDYSAPLTKWRCCIDYSLNYYPWRVSIMAESSQQVSFFDALFDALASNFVINFICFAFIFMVFGASSRSAACRVAAFSYSPCPLSHP